MYDFIYIWWEWEKNPEICTIRKNKEKFPVWLPSHPPVYKKGADCFPVYENTEKKPDQP